MTTTDWVLLGLGLLVADLHLSLPAIARFVVRWRVSRLRPDLAERMREEWLAEIDACPSHLLKFWFALGLVRGIGDLIRADREQPKKEAPLNVVLRAEQGRLHDSAKITGTLTNVTLTPEPANMALSGHAPTVIVSAVGVMNSGRVIKRGLHGF